MPKPLGSLTFSSDNNLSTSGLDNDENPLPLNSPSLISIIACFVCRIICIFKYLVLIVGLNLLPNDDLEKKFKILSNDEILLKNNNAGARATGRKFNFPENIKTNAIVVIKRIIKYFFSLLDI